MHRPPRRRSAGCWPDGGRKFPWADTVARWPSGAATDGEYGHWLDLPQRVKARRIEQPGPLLEKVNTFAGRTDLQRIGVRRAEITRKLDGVFVLLAKGLVFKFLGSTEPGATKDPRGLKGDINDGSAGCQVINGSLYMDPADKLVDCTAFAAINNGEVASNPARTRAVYNGLQDLLTALGSDLSPTLKDTLLTEEDLALHAERAVSMAKSREPVITRIG